MKKGKNFLLGAMVIGIIDIVVIGYRLYNIMAQSQNDWERLGIQVGINMITPFLLCFVIGLVFNILAFAQYNKIFALVAGILYTAGVVLNMNMLLDLGLAAAFCYIAFAKMEKTEQ